MKTTLAIATLLGVLMAARSAAGQTMVDITGAMGTASALSSGAATGASTAHAAMATALRNLPTPGSGLGMPDAPSSHATSGGSGGWATPGSSSSGRGWATAARGSSGSTGGWMTASAGRQTSGTSTWMRAESPGKSGAASTWATRTK
jgi:hypothetical protein